MNLLLSLVTLIFLSVTVINANAARRDIVGFESGSTGTHELVTSGGTMSAQTTAKRSGTYALEVNPTTTNVGWVRLGSYGADGQHLSALNVATLYVRFYLCAITLPAATEESIFYARGSGSEEKLSLRLTTAGKIAVYNTTPTLVGTSTTALAASACTSSSQYTRVEVKIGTGASAAAELVINGSVEVTTAATNLNTMNNGLVVLGKNINLNGNTIDLIYDDVAVDDAAYPGDGQVRVLVPTANGSTMQWTAGTHSSNYVEVADLPAVTANYVKNVAQNDVALFAMSDSSTVGATGSAVVSAVKSIIAARLDTAGTDGVQLRVKSGTTNTDLTAVALDTNGFLLSNVRATDPNTSAAWTLAAIDALEVGAVESTAVLSRLTEVYAMIEYTAATTPSTLGPQTIIQTPLASGTKFASTSGSGTTCSQALPCTLTYLTTHVTAGDVVFLRGGSYGLAATYDFSTSGTAAAPITWESYPGETAIIDGSAVAEGTQRYNRVGGDYNVFRRLEITGMPSQGFYISGSHNLVDGLYIHDAKISGLQIADAARCVADGLAFNCTKYASFNEVKNSTIKNNSDVNTSGGGNADCISISAGNANYIHHNWVEHCSDDGIDTWKSLTAIVRYNISSNMGIGSGNGNGYKCGGAVPSNGTTCDHNISYNNRTAGFDINTGKNTLMEFNTAWDSDGYGYTNCFGSDPCAGNTITRSNIALANFGSNTNSGATTGNASFSNNSWQRGGLPAFISTVPTSPNFLRPTVGGGFEDIGAYAGSAVDTDLPTTPVIAASTNSAGQITITITTASTDSSGIKAYNLRRCTPSACSPTVIRVTLAGNATGFVDTGLTASTGYSYDMAAVDNFDKQGAFSTVKSATTTALFRRILGYDWFDSCADGTTPPTGWTGGYQNDFVCISKQVRAGGVGLNTFATYNGVTNSGDAWCQFEIELISGSGVRAPGCSLRWTTTPATVTGYSFRPQLPLGSNIRNDVAGVGTVLGSEATSDWQQGDKGIFERRSTSCYGYRRRGTQETLVIGPTSCPDVAGIGNLYGLPLFIASGSPSDVQVDKPVFGDFVGTDPTHPTITSVTATNTQATVVAANSPLTIRVQTATISKTEPIANFPANLYTYPADVLATIPNTTFITFCPRDAADVENTAGCKTATITPPSDTTPPVLTNTTASPAPAGTTSWTISVSSSEPLTATYGLTDLAYNATGSIPMTCISLTCSATAMGLSAGTTHFYVRGKDSANNANTSSLDIALVVSASTADTTPPSTVTNLVCVASSSQGECTWSAATDNIAVQDYTLYLSPDATCSALVPAISGITTTNTIVALNPNSSYCAAVKARDTSQNLSADYSNLYTFTTTVPIDTTPPSDMVGLTATPFTTSILLNWTDGTDNIAVTSSIIEMCKGAACVTVPFEVTATKKLITTFQGLPLTPSTVYCMRGKHSDGQNVSVNYSATVCTTTLATGSGHLTLPRTPISLNRAPRVP